MDQCNVLLTPRQAAERLKLTPATLQRMRSEGSGPRFCQIGKRRVAYREADIVRWINDRTVKSCADARERGLIAPYHKPI